MGRPLAQSVSEQQKIIERMGAQLQVQGAQIAYIASLAGITPQVNKVASLMTQADAANPGQPVPDPASQGPAETTEQAATPEASDDVRNPGLTPGSVQHVPADTTDVALNPGESLPTAPYNNLMDVTAPVAGTETHVPNDQTRIETDVRVGDPMNPQIAYPWDISPNQSNGGGKAASAGNRTLASLRLARLQIAAGLSGGEDLAVAAAIEGSNMTDEQIAAKAATLAEVQKASGANQGRPANLVPRAAAASPAGGVARTTPSLATDGGVPRTASAPSTVDEDLANADLFM